jgi:hypothetical protein
LGGKVKTPLPENDDPEAQSLTFYKYPDIETTVNEPSLEPRYDPDIREMLETARNLAPVKVAASLRNPHPMVEATRAWIDWRERPADKRVKRTAPSHDELLDVQVSRSQASRALRFMDALIKRVERIGGSVEIQRERWNTYRRQTVVCFGGESVARLRLREKNNQIRIPPEERKSSWGSAIELEPSGLLTLDDGPSYSIHTWLRDTPKRHRIEDGLNDLIIGFVKRAGDARIRRREAEEARKRWEEQERIRQQQEEELRQRREALQKLQEAEQARVDELLEHARRWQASHVVREYLGAVCDLLLHRDGRIDIESEAAQYLRWAHQQADRLDPLRPSPHSVLDERI